MSLFIVQNVDVYYMFYVLVIFEYITNEYDYLSFILKYLCTLHWSVSLHP